MGIKATQTVATLSIEWITQYRQAVEGLNQIRSAMDVTTRHAIASQNRAEAAAVRYAEKLEREAQVIGKTAAEVKKLEVELNALNAEKAGLADLAQRIRAAGAAVVSAGGGVTRSNGAMRAGAMQLTQNLNDVAVQWQAQTPLMTIFAQQSGQVVGALGLMAGETKGLLGFLAGPWGLALTTAGILLAPFVAKLWEGSESAKQQAEALKAQRKAIEDLDAATGRGNKTLEQRIRLGIEATKTALNEAMALRTRLAAELASLQLTASGGRAANYGANYSTDIQLSNGDIQARIAANNAAIKENEDRLRAAARLTIMRQVTAETDKSAAATQRYETALGRLNQEYDAGGVANGEYYRQLKAITQQRDLELSADKRAAAAKREHTKELREAAKAARELEKAQRELQSTYDGLLARFMPVAAAEQAYMRTLTDIEKVKRAGMYTDAQVADARMGALKDYIEALRAAREKEGLGLDIKLNIDTSQLVQNMSAFTTSIDDAIERVRRLGDNLSDAFGQGGNALGRMMILMAEYGKRQSTIDDQVKAGDLERAKAAKQSADLQLDTLIGLTSAAKGLFSEHSKGYKAMVAAEQALTVVQLARTAVDVAGGAARMFATLGPLGFPAVAAMLGVMASLGFNSGASVNAPTTNQGTGTVFGDTSAKSDSIKRSIDLLADLDTEMLVVSRQMAASLKAIESNIGGLTNLVIRLGGVDGIGSNAAKDVNTGFKRDLLGTALEEGLTRGVSGFMGMAAGMLIAGPLGGAIGLALGALTDFTKKIPILGDILGGIGSIIGGLFGTKTKVVGSGIFGAPQTLADIDALGFTGQTFADIQKKKKVLGVTTSTKYSTQFGELDASLEDQFGKLLLSFADTIKLAAGPLGLATADIEAKLNSFVVDLGKIDLKDLTGEEIQEKLTAVFGAQADKMAQFVIDLQRFQGVGEGAFETLVRVASTVDVVTTSLQQLGLSSQSLGIDASMAIADLFGGAQDYATAANAYFEAFYSDAEQAAARAAQLGRVFDSLGVTMPDSIAAYRALVEAQDLTTAAGQQLYAQLLQLAPAFAEIVSAGKSAASAAAILRERQDLEKQLLELQGNTVALRQRELEQLDPSNRALQMQIWAIQDQQKAAQDAASAAKELADAWGSVGDSIMAEVKRIRALDATAAASSYQTLAAQFNAASAAARRGDMDAAKSLPELSRSLLDAAAGQVGSRRELDLIRGQTAASLEQTYRATEKMVSQQQAAADLASRALQVAVDQQGWWQSFADQQAAAADSSKAANDALVEELQGLRAQVATLAEDQRTIGATLAGNTGKVAKFTDNVTRGGDTVIVEIEGTVKTEAA
ncbi:hypothetical protein GG804_14180 [Sphingomonas histidinilytica]|uniref:hypothetical protein n=1 Tax=Rhizorhabdus histidinilytica TaxID=439228 RepID=UPI001ADC8014|nr:hypothetical protein [Rhizorhabdus histidinilytica]MBO9377918.1 hypothetical protein [Rhizorhabdus histidinilytica]